MLHDFEAKQHRAPDESFVPIRARNAALHYAEAAYVERKEFTVVDVKTLHSVKRYRVAIRFFPLFEVEEVDE